MHDLGKIDIVLVFTNKYVAKSLSKYENIS